jgi:hypothetical protein
VLALAAGAAAAQGFPSKAVRIVELPEVKDGMLRDGFAVVPAGPVEYDAFVRAKMEQIQKIGSAAKVKLD